MVTPLAFDGALSVDIPVMIAVAIACLPIFWNGYALMRWEGIVFLVFYAAYIAWLVLENGDHAVKDDYRIAMLFFVIPLTVLSFIVIAFRSRRTDRTRV